MKKTNFKLFTMFLAGILFSTFAVFAATISVPTNFTTNAVQYLQKLVLKNTVGNTGIVLDANSSTYSLEVNGTGKFKNLYINWGIRWNWIYLDTPDGISIWERYFAWFDEIQWIFTEEWNNIEDIIWVRIFSHWWSFAWDNLRIDNNGNVGIWTGTPSEKLHVYWATQIGQSLKLFSNTDTNANPTIEALGNAKPIVFMTSWSESMRITAASKVGIGTNNPKAKLQVNGNVKFSSIGEGTWEFIIQDDPNGTEAMRVDMQNKRLIFDSNNDWYNVGIWTSNPSSKLEVVWDTKISGDLNIKNDSLYVGGNNGYVGIGTSDPRINLDVIGTIFWDNINTPNLIFKSNPEGILMWGSPTIKLSWSNLNIIPNMYGWIILDWNVWIWNDSPYQKLDVNGAIKIWYPATNTWCNSSNEWTLAYHHISWWSEIVICMLKNVVPNTYRWVTIISATGWFVSNPALNNSVEIGDLWWS